METKHLSYIRVQNFKRFDSLEAHDIGQFNLIVGDNNVGKTSLLEALCFDDEDFVSFARNYYHILGNRHLLKLSAEITPLDLLTTDGKSSIKYVFRYGKNVSDRITASFRSRKSLDTEEIYSVRAKLEIYADKQFIEFIKNDEKKLVFFSEDPAIDYIPLIPFANIYGNELVEYFSRFAKSNNWLENFKITVKTFIPLLTSIEVSSAFSINPSIIIREEEKDISQPLSQYGDGFIKLFRILLEMELCVNKRLMIDEIDAGIHYSRLKDFLKKILQSAKNKNVQIFATTHSKECIQCYTEALQELGYEKDSRIIKMADTKVGIKAYTYNFEQFENSLYAYSEIR